MFTQESRLKYLDIASGIMIVWLLIYHALYPMYEDTISAAIPFLYFFMPYFFYKSGMMFQIKDVKSLFIKDFKKLIVTFIIWSAIGYIMMVLWHLFNDEELTWKILLMRPIRSLILTCSVPMNIALWFLPVLFIVRQLTNWLLKRFKSYFVAICSLIFAIICLVLNSYISPYCLPTWISATAWGMFFFSSAIYLREYEVKKWMIILSISIYVISLFTSIPSVYGAVEPGVLLNSIWYITSLFSCICFNNVCRFIVYFYNRIGQNMNTKFLFPILTYVGRNAMSFYVVHYIIFKIVFDLIWIYKNEYYETYQGLIIVLLCYAIICPLVSVMRNKIKRVIITNNNNDNKNICEKH
ncbi:MAG: acyltransferase family protein [Paludibacteraceae bacterium]|nr:acyltransferase family protein [Paludibacteraceae bacterium]